MPYKDDLGAAHQRILQLERENAKIKEEMKKKEETIKKEKSESFLHKFIFEIIVFSTITVFYLFLIWTAINY